MMSRKHYIAIAEAIVEGRKESRYILGSKESKTANIAINLVTEEIARVLKFDNPNFDYDRFYRAAGMGEYASN